MLQSKITNISNTCEVKYRTSVQIYHMKNYSVKILKHSGEKIKREKDLLGKNGAC